MIMHHSFALGPGIACIAGGGKGGGLTVMPQLHHCPCSAFEQQEFRFPALIVIGYGSIAFTCCDLRWPLVLWLCPVVRVLAPQ